MKRLLTAAMAVLALAATPEECAMPTNHMGDTTIHKLTTPADGETVFNDRPLFNAGIEIPAAASNMAGMEGRLPVSAPSFSYSTDGATGGGYGRLFSMLDSEKASDDEQKSRAVIATFEGVVSGQNAVKVIGITATPKDTDPDSITYPNILEIEVPQAYEGGFTGRFFLGRHADWPNHWRITLSVVMTDGAAFDYDLAYDPPDSDIDFHVMLQRQGGDGLTAFWTTAIKFPE